MRSCNNCTFDFFRFGPRAPIEFVGLEITYFFIVAILCLLIYFKTRKIYFLTKHQGIGRFRNVFFYFFLSYLFNLTHFFIFRARSLFAFEAPFLLMGFNFFLVAYASTMALISLIMTLSSKKLVFNKKELLTNNLIALIISAVAFFTHSPEFILIIQLIFVVSLFITLSKNSIKISGQNQLTYLVLLLLWFINLFLINRSLIFELKIPLYLVSAWAFMSIYLRVRKRLKNGKKKR